MSKATIINKYGGYLETNDEILVNSQVECEHQELIEIFKDLFCFCGEYKIEYEYDGKYIKLKSGYHIPLGQRPMLITHEWGDYAIENMSDWSNRKRIVNDI